MELTQSLPWTQNPLIINAPMGGIAGADLAIAVSNAGGLGQIGVDDDLKDLTGQLLQVEQALGRRDGVLPVGVGLLSFLMEQEPTLRVLKQFQPAVVWLFAANDLRDYSTWAKTIRRELPRSQVWVQIGSVDGAVRIAKDVRPDAMCIQGIDAGGHGYEKGASLISLLPEVLDALREAGHGDISIVGAGGIADARSAAAAFTLGAQGIVMGTRFLSAPETRIHPQYRASILAARDGGQQTVRSKVFDQLRGPNPWPGKYDGRSISTASYRDHVDGVEIDEIRKRYSDAAKSENAGFAGADGRAATWAGTGVGLVKQEQAAAEIVNEVRSGILKVLQDVKSRL